jgi:geranylgeranylglycerol-phosphate geranylgeranyltransferase
LTVASKLVAHVETWRPYTATYPGLLALAAAFAWPGTVPPAAVAAVIFVIPTLGWLAALYGCDFLDSDLDRIEKGHRPIPSGRLSQKEAILAMLACVYFGLVGAAWLGMRAIALSGVAMVSSATYGLAKGRPFLGPLARGLAAPCTVFFGALSASSGHPRYAWLMLTVFFLHDITTNIVGEIRDVHGDALAGCETLAVRYGVRTVSRGLALLFVIWEGAAAALPFALDISAAGFYPGYLLALALGVVAMALIWRDPERRRVGLLAHKLFVLERLLLAGALIAAVSPTAALLLVPPLMLLTQISQTLLRDRHEFGRPAAQPSLPGQADGAEHTRLIGEQLWIATDTPQTILPRQEGSPCPLTEAFPRTTSNQ